MNERQLTSNQAVLFGGYWDGPSFSGSRASGWNAAPSASSYFVSARAVCDHLNLDTLNESEERRLECL